MGREGGDTDFFYRMLLSKEAKMYVRCYIDQELLETA